VRVRVRVGGRAPPPLLTRARRRRHRRQRRVSRAARQRHHHLQPPPVSATRTHLGQGTGPATHTHHTNIIIRLSMSLKTTKRLNCVRERLQLDGNGLITFHCLMWYPGQNKRITLLSFLNGCYEKRLKD
jgi:hypothetical protein